MTWQEFLEVGRVARLEFWEYIEIMAQDRVLVKSYYGVVAQSVLVFFYAASASKRSCTSFSWDR